jgi:hypothetical protein
MTEIEVPVHIGSPLNGSHGHWARPAKRNSLHRSAAWFALKGAKVKPVLPCTVTLTRIAPRELDGDNLQGGFKSVRDGIADWLGVKDDSDPRITWRYAQAKGKVREYTARVRIE